jgi:colanic acid biosynthesis glycosyl transferase WcaI
MRILMLTQWFDPEPTFKGLAFARELVRRGHQVEVVTGFPNYPGGKLYDGYRIRFLQREEVDGIAIIRVPLYPSHDGSALGRAANYLSFAASAALLGSLLVKRADVMYVYHPPATVGLAACVISLVRRIPFVYDIQDLWPDTLASTGMVNSGRLLGLVQYACSVIYRRAARIAVLSPGFQARLVERGVPANKLEVIYNWCDETSIRAAGSSCLQGDPFGMAGRFNVVFAGTMGKAQALDAVLEAARLIKDTLARVQLVFVGGGIEVEKLKMKAAAQGLSNVRFLPRMPMGEIGSLLALADVLLVHLRDDPLFEITVPSKTQAYMAAGRPILMAVRGDAAALVERGGAGVVCRPEDPESIAAAIGQLAQLSPEELTLMGERGRAFYQGHLSLAAGTDKFVNLFQAL